MPVVSLVIPARQDAAALRALLAQVLPTDDVEVIVAVAMPVDEETKALRRQHGRVTWVESAPGRGMQLNAGAARATGEWLWFVHADSRLPDGWLDAFRQLSAADAEGRSRGRPAVVEGPTSVDGIVGGAFRFALDSPAWQARVLESAVAWRVRWFNLPYGDQGIFVRRAVFHSLGGFRPLPLMEDVEFVGRLRRQGRLRHLTLSLMTSARRWAREGWWRRSAGNLLILGLYGVGVTPEKLAKRYHGRKRVGA
jgi:rSAM/selenodomain-associated transferase 2